MKKQVDQQANRGARSNSNNSNTSNNNDDNDSNDNDNDNDNSNNRSKVVRVWWGSKKQVDRQTNKTNNLLVLISL